MQDQHGRWIAFTTISLSLSLPLSISLSLSIALSTSLYLSLSLSLALSLSLSLYVFLPRSLTLCVTCLFSLPPQPLRIREVGSVRVVFGPMMESGGDRLVIILKPVWNRFGFVLQSLWDDHFEGTIYGIDVGQFLNLCARVGAILESGWDRYGVGVGTNLESVWARCVIVMEPRWDHCAI